MALNQISTGSNNFTSFDLFYYIKGSKDYPLDQLLDKPFGYDTEEETDVAQTAIFTSSIKTLLTRLTSPKQIDNLYSLMSGDAMNEIPSMLPAVSTTNVRAERSQEYISSIIQNAAAIPDLEVSTDFRDHINPNYSYADAKPNTTEKWTSMFDKIVYSRSNPIVNNKITISENVFWQKMFSLIEYLKKYESEIVSDYYNAAQEYPYPMRSLDNATLAGATYYGSSVNLENIRTILTSENILGRYILLFIGLWDGRSVLTNAEAATGEYGTYNDGTTTLKPIKFNPYRVSEIYNKSPESFHSDKLNNSSTLTSLEGLDDVSEEMMWGEYGLNIQYVQNSAMFAVSPHDGRLKNVKFRVKYNVTASVVQTVEICVYFDPDAFIKTKGTSEYEVWTYNDLDNDIVTDKPAGYNYLDNDYANVLADMQNTGVKSGNFKVNQEEMNRQCIDAVKNIMATGKYTDYTRFSTTRVSPYIDDNGQVQWDLDYSIQQHFFIFYGDTIPTSAEQISIVQDYLRNLHANCHDTTYDPQDNSKVLTIGHNLTTRDEFLSHMYPDLFTTNDVILVPINNKYIISTDLQDGETNPDNYVHSVTPAMIYTTLNSLNGKFSAFEFSKTGTIGSETIGGQQINLPTEVFYLGGINRDVSSMDLDKGQIIIDFPWIATSFNDTRDKPLTSKTGFGNYKQKIFTEMSSNPSYSDLLQLTVLYLTINMFIMSNQKQRIDSVQNISISYERDPVADSSLPESAYNVAKFVINNVQFTVYAQHKKNFGFVNSSSSRL